MTQPLDTPTKTHGTGALFKLDGLNILTISGTPRELGLQHGHLLADEIRSGAVPFFASKTLNDEGDTEADALYRIVDTFVPDEYRQELEGIAEGSGLSYEQVFRANFYSEFSQNRAAQQTNAYLNKQAQASGGCSSIVALQEASKTGRLIHAKNQDYEGAGHWDRHHTVTLCAPESGHRHIKVTTAGLIKANFCANDQGLTIGGHFLFSLGARIEGTGYTALENRLIREASSLDEAVEIIRNTARSGSFAFVLTSWKENRAVVVECNSEEIAIRHPIEGRLTMSNVATANETMAAKDILMLIGSAQNPIARATRLQDRLAECDKLDIADLVGTLSDHVDPAAKCKRALGNVLAQPLTVTSAACDPENGRLWVATGKAPVSNNSYVGLKISEALAGTGPLVVEDTLTPPDSIDPHRLQALRLFVEAQNGFEADHSQWQKAAELIERAIECDTDEPIYRRVLARLLLRAERIEEAKAVALGAIELPQSSAEKAESLMLVGIADDLLGLRQEAVGRYDEALSQPFSPTDPLTRLDLTTLGQLHKHRDQPFNTDDAAKLSVSFTGL